MLLKRIKMLSYKKKQIKIKTTIVTIFITALFVPTTILTNALDCKPVINDCKKSTIISEEISLDIGLIYNVTKQLANIINESEDYWQGRRYGTPGEWRAAEILQNLWNETIAKNNDNIDNAVRELIDDGTNDFIDDDVQIKNKNDYKLEIFGEETPKDEYFPIVTLTKSSETYEFYNATVHLTPDEIYTKTANSIFEENEYPTQNFHEMQDILYNKYGENQYTSTNALADIDLEVDTIQGCNEFLEKSDNSSSNTHHIYLIEMKKFREYNLSQYSVQKIVNRLIEYTQSSSTAIDAFLCADFNDDTYHMLAGVKCISGTELRGFTIPGMMINGSLGNKIRENIENNVQVTADFYLRTYFNDSVKSYNLMGTIPGESTKTILVGAHYDGYSGGYVIDNAVGVAILLGLAKYFGDNVNNGIYPYYTTKFVFFGGEDSVWRGSCYYVQKHKPFLEEEVLYYINIDTVAYKNSSEYAKEELHLNMWHFPYNEGLNSTFLEIAEDSNYKSRSGGYGIETKGRDYSGVGRCDGAAFIGHVRRAVIAFDKGDPTFAWHFYQRDGGRHTKGDTLDKLDYLDLEVTAEVILNMTKKLSLLGKTSISTEYDIDENLEIIETEKEDAQISFLL